MKKFRLATVAAAGALATAAAILTPASAQAAPSYWTFKNWEFHTCLTAGDSGSAYATSCSDSARQQWDWVGSDHFQLLKNRKTGKCLTSDGKSDATNGQNSVWTTDCDKAIGWHYGGDTRWLQNNVGDWDHGFLRTSDVRDAVYTSGKNQVGPDYYKWTGTVL
ncbi:ricin-type beta-trefoil lectin domain protein [Streptomyces longispororuber]|uniref:RICIN domain-containing protein n=1 Tax=Streptomyces longispororuber TaxID=68230 RepID=UPI0033FE5291